MTEVIEGTVVGSQVAPAVESAAPTLKELTTRYAVLDLLAKALTERAKQEKPSLFTQMLAAREDTGGKSFNVRVGDDVVATATITEPQGKFVVDDKDALIDWCLKHFPAEVETITQVREAFAKALVDKYVAGDESGVFLKDVSIAPDDAKGQEVPGLRYVPPGDPSTFSVRWKNNAAKGKVLDGVMGEVAPVLGITAGGDK